MEETTIKVPKFRSARRALDWLKKSRWNKPGLNRLPPDREEVFFRGKEEPRQLANIVYNYACIVGERLSERFENLLRPNHDELLRYITQLKNRGEEVCPTLVDELKGDSRNLCHWARVTEQRLPKHLEDTLDDPHYCLEYATDILRGRLPEHLEKVFFKSADHASRYAFEVIRGFSPIKLPDDLHAFMVMKSFEQPNNRAIKEYMEASEDDPNKIGNHSS